jgi:hypothetical protein
MQKLPIAIGEKKYCSAGLAAAVALGAMTTLVATTPSMAQPAGAQSWVATPSLVENAAYVARRGVVVGRGYRGAYVGRGYGYRRHYGYGAGAGVAGAAVGAAILGGALAAPYYAQPYGYPQPYGYAPGYAYPPGYGYAPGYYPY